MLWHHAWIETRSRFVAGMAVLFCTAAMVVLLWPRVSSEVAAAGLKDTLDISHNFRNYVWDQWYRSNLTNLAVLFAIILGAGGLLSPKAGGLFLLALPCSRKRLLLTRAALGGAALLVMIGLSSLTIPLLAPAVGKSFGVPDAVVHGICSFVVAAVFFSFSFLLSSEFQETRLPLIVGLGVAIALGLIEQASGIGIFHVMSAESWFRSGRIPWGGLSMSVAASVTMLWAALANIIRKDF
jgi:ABC-2 type transport system permease protein